MSADRWNEALEAAADKLLVRACGYLARYDTIYNGRIVSEELLCLAKAILALREADQRGAAAQDNVGDGSDATSRAECKQPAPHHPGRQEKGDGKPAPASPGPTVVEKLRGALRMVLDDYTAAGVRLSQDHYIHVALAAAEEKHSG